MQSKIGKYTVNFFNEQEFHSLKREIFTNDSYYFESETEEPVIIDVGAYVGLSVLYFKQLFPNCRVLAFEPNPVAVEKLKENIFINEAEDVEIYDSAIWTKDGFKDLYIDNSGLQRYSVGSFKKGAWNGEVVSKKITVKTEDLTKYIKTDIDMLKLDVEGSEHQILKSIAPHLTKIKNIVVEYHPVSNQNIHKILNMLERRYTVTIFDEGKEIKRDIPENRLLTIRATCRH